MISSGQTYFGVDILPVMGSWGDTYGKSREPFPSDMVNARIVAIGTPGDASLEQAGLIIDYVPPGGRLTRRLVLGFNDLGMWITECGEIGH